MSPGMRDVLALRRKDLNRLRSRGLHDSAFSDLRSMSKLQKSIVAEGQANLDKIRELQIEEAERNLDEFVERVSA